MQARVGNPLVLVPDAGRALMALGRATRAGGVPARTLDLVHLRASQINGCAVCVDMHARELRQSGADEPTVHAVAAWEDAPQFSAAERAALRLAGAVTRIADTADVIAVVNLWNRLNRATRQRP